MTSKVENRCAARAFGYLTGLCLVAIAALGPSTTAMALTKVKAGHLVALDMARLFAGKESGCFEKARRAVLVIEKLGKVRAPLQSCLAALSVAAPGSTLRASPVWFDSDRQESGG
jgi:hypothetical protein